MQTTGTITQIQPAGGYQSRNGYIYTFNMGIDGPGGAICGEIGAKTENYPLTIGQQITVEVTQSPHGTRFKRINPQYAQPQQQQYTPPPPQQSTPPAPQQIAPPTNTDRTVRNRGIALSYVFDLLKMPYGVEAFETAIAIADFMETGRIPIVPTQTTASNPDYDNGPPPKDDDLRF